MTDFYRLAVVKQISQVVKRLGEVLVGIVSDLQTNFRRKPSHPGTFFKFFVLYLFKFSLQTLKQFYVLLYIDSEEL
jgi:hypothetical protein